MDPRITCNYTSNATIKPIRMLRVCLFIVLALFVGEMDDTLIVGMIADPVCILSEEAQEVTGALVLVGTLLLVIPCSPLEEIAADALLESHTADVELGLEALPHSSLLSGILVLGAQIVLDTAVVVGIRVLASPPSLLK